MPFSFSTALSGLRASSDALSTTGNNIANANTIAFKSSAVSFADVFASASGTRINGAGGVIQFGNGVRTAATRTNFAQGNINESASATNAAIQGNGFFVVEDGAGFRAFTRAGDFVLNREGYLVTPGGHKVLGYMAVDGKIQPGTPVAPIKVPLGEIIPPAMTTRATLRANLDSSAPISAVFHAPVQVFDSRGVAHVLDLTFTKQGNGQYDVTATLDGTTAQLSADGGAPTNQVTFSFDANGLLQAPATSLAILPNQSTLDGATLPQIDLELYRTNPDGSQGPSNFTNYSGPSAVSATDQNGFAAGSLNGISISTDSTGTLYGIFSNGQTRALAQFALASFNSQDGLRHLGNNLFGETPASGQPSIGPALTGGRGEVVGSALEQSNVDIATEFTELIVAQRSFQANSRVISTINQTLQDLMQVI